MALWLLWLACTVGAARAATVAVTAADARIDVTEQTDWWVDTTGTLTAADVAARAPTLALHRSVATQTHRLGDGALWQRLVVGPLPSGQRWYLQVSFHGVDRASLYHQDSTGQWVGQHAGDHVSVAQWPLRDRLPAFALQQGDGAREYWLRIANKPIPVGAQLLLLNEDAFTDWRNTSYLLLGAYFGLALLVIYLSALAARQYADRAFAAYCAYAASMMMIQVCFMGVGGLFLWPQAPWWNNAAPYIFTMLSCTTATLLVREVCAVPRLSAPLDRFMQGWAAFGVVGGVGYVAWPGATAFLVISLYQVGTMVLVLAISAWSHRQGERWALGLGLCFLPVVLTAPFPALRNLGLLNASFLTQYSLAIGAALEIPLQLWLLSRRARENSDANVRAHAMDTSDPLTGLPAQHVLHFRLRDALRRARRNRQRCAVLAVDVANYPDIVSQHGRDAADRALVLAGARIRGVTRDVDTVSRTDTHHFAVLMEGPVLPAQVVALATQAVAHGLNPSPQLPAGVVLKLHIATVLAPDSAQPASFDADNCLRWLAGELARLPPEGRKTILHLNY